MGEQSKVAHVSSLAEELSRTAKALNVPKDAYQRAGRRFSDVVRAKGVDKAIDATRLRITRITKPEKAAGVIKFLNDFLSGSGMRAFFRGKLPEPTSAQRKGIKSLISLAKSKQ